MASLFHCGDISTAAYTSRTIAFLPMNSLLTPVHRLIGGVLVLMVLTFAAWAALGQVDIVVQAQGKLVPATAVKVSQPVEAGPVVELLVKDGQAVKAGELLARLDSTQSSKDSEALRAELALARARLSALDSALTGRETSTQQATVDTEFLLRQAAYREAQQGAQSALLKAQAELSSTQQTLAKQQRTLTLAEHSEAAHASLKDQGFVSEIAYQDKLKERIEREQDARALEANARANTAAVAQAQSALAAVTSEFRKQLAQERTQVLTQLQKTESELGKAEHRTALTEVRAPVAGVVNSLAIRSAGQVVSAGAALMTIVPADEALIAEGWVRNEDVGFVSPGMPVKVKLAAFPFQKYGWMDGDVAWVGADSEVPETMRNAQGEPLFYKARITLRAQALARDGKTFDVKPGMQAVIDVQLGERSLLEYLTSPLKKAVLEAARER